MAKSLRDLFFEHDAKMIDKWEQYLAIYEVELGSFVERGCPVRLLEVGVQNGGSLEIWAKYLPPGSSILGIDIDAKVGQLSFDDAAITVSVADATDATQMEGLLGDRSFDIIIDDGSHLSADVVAAFRILYPRLAPSGRYVVEDLHTSYWPTYGGGYRTEAASIEWFKHLADVLNADHIPMGTRLTEPEQEIITLFQASVARVSFFDSVVAVEKLPTVKLQPYRRVISGQTAEIVTKEQFLAAVPSSSLLPMLFGQATASQINSKLIETLEEAHLSCAHTASLLSRADAALKVAQQELQQKKILSSTAMEEQSILFHETLQIALAVREAEHSAALQVALAEQSGRLRVLLQAALETLAPVCQ